jgi:hypothetical protein
MASEAGNPLRLEDIVELDEDASPETNAERARQQAEFHAREVRELGELIAADPALATAKERALDPRQAERRRHRELEMICREVTAALDWLVEKRRPSRDLDRAMEYIQQGYNEADEIRLLRRIAETTYPLLTTMMVSRQNGVGLLSETKLSLKHAARGQALSDTLTSQEAAQLLAGWLNRAIEIGIRPQVYIVGVRQAIEWFVHLAGQRTDPAHARSLEDDLEAVIYLSRGTLDEAGLPYKGPEEAVLDF